MRAILAALAILSCAGGLEASPSLERAGVGTTSAGFLKLPVGARAVAMGEAMTTAADDAAAVYWNPAALLNLSTAKSWTFETALHPGSIIYNHGGFAARSDRFGALGLNIQSLSYGDIAQTDEAGQNLGTYAPKDSLIAGAYAFGLGPFGFGAALKSLKMKIATQAAGIAFDAGISWPEVPVGNAQFSATVRNMGRRVKFHEEAFPLPQETRFGGIYYVQENLITVLDVAFPLDNQGYFGFGGERIAKKGEFQIASRLGFNSRKRESRGIYGLSAGIGLHYRAISFDYAVFTLGELGVSQRATLSVGLGDDDPWARRQAPFEKIIWVEPQKGIPGGQDSAPVLAPTPAAIPRSTPPPGTIEAPKRLYKLYVKDGTVVIGEIIARTPEKYVVKSQGTIFDIPAANVILISEYR